jgi:uncharacterized protein (DUF58 family)
MYVTGRAAFLVGVGVVPIVLVCTIGPWRVGPSADAAAWLATVAWLVLCAVLVGADAVAATAPRRVRVERSLPPRAVLGRVVETRLTLHNSAARAITGLLRDAWQPTAARRAA